MTKIDRLIKNYANHISIPWREVSPGQRVVFCVYEPKEEMKLKFKINEFELVTRQHNHDWFLYDFTSSFPNWMASLKYSKQYFKKPNLLETILQDYLDYIKKDFEEFLTTTSNSNNSVITLTGIGTLFGFLKVKDVLEKIAPLVSGRLVVLFPGKIDGNNYRLLDEYDGWNYLAVSITSDKDF